MRYMKLTKIDEDYPSELYVNLDKVSSFTRGPSPHDPDKECTIVEMQSGAVLYVSDTPEDITGRLHQ